MVLIMKVAVSFDSMEKLMITMYEECGETNNHYFIVNRCTSEFSDYPENYENLELNMVQMTCIEYIVGINNGT
ncbi:hypothetical protein PIROE2DRAFT_10744 [Piromyces sp. E2]|nr:hypothetical protein PIROE2DRAFT_10744 [Piromyces sp. E2]|eukprot:OUM62880.1 hypothetical protein PIROE2DRAFT_10744 [Piromyces sp. E2]